MREPNFSESQLQQATNTAFIRKVFELCGNWAFACVPSLFAEFDLGWDTAFHLPWLSHKSNPDHEGCNFFLQYKLSGELTSPGAKEWTNWGVEYFRFKIPHSTRDSSGAFVDDYHQWDRLKALAKKNYPTFYATNSTLRKADLQAALEAGTLLNHVPLLDVRTVKGVHKHVTFTKMSNAFALHSEKEDAAKNTLSEVIDLLKNEEQSPLRTSTEKLFQVLKEIGEDDEGWHRDLARWSVNGNLLDRVQPWAQQVFLASFVRKHLGADLLWLPKVG